MHKLLIDCNQPYFVQVRQLKWLGFKPVVVPYSVLNSESMAASHIPRLLKLERVKMPNLDDGFIEKNRRF